MANKYALLIGTSEYQDERLARLKTPAADLNVLARLLGDQNIGGYQVRVLLNQPFTTVLKEIVSFLKDRLRDDHLLLYFSGHGILDEGGNLYLATKDTERDLLSATALSNRFIKDEMDRSRSKRQVLILDCCHSGAFLKGTKGDSPALTQATFEGYGRAVLTAADSIQYALEGDQVDEGLELSLFTHFLVEGIQTGEADRSNDGWIELDEWFDYAFRKVRDHTDKQTPRKFVDNQYGELYIARNPKANEVKPAELPERLRARIKSEYKPDRLEAIQELGGFLEGDDPSLVMSAQIALEKISVDDDSLSIRNSAAGLLAQHAERQALQKAEEERRVQEQAEAERLAALNAEEERRARQKAEAERLKALEAEERRLARDRAEAEKQARLKAKEERKRAEAERLVALKAEEKRKQAEADRQAHQRAEPKQMAQEKAGEGHLAAQPVGAGLMAGEVREIEQPAHEGIGVQFPADIKRTDRLPRWVMWVGLLLVGGMIVGLIISRQANLGGLVTPAITAYPRPTGRIAFMTSRDGNGEIYVMNADGSGLTRLTNNSGWDMEPAWSPDGRRIAFASDRDGDQEIFVMNADGSGLVQLTNNSADDIDPAWSPDGTRIAFASYKDGNYNIYSMNADGSGLVQLTNDPKHDNQPSWSPPDGNRIAFVSQRDGNAKIYMMNADGSEQTPLTNNTSVEDEFPAWSIDGTRIAFQSLISEQNGKKYIWEIYTMNADGSGQTRLTKSAGNNFNPVWSPDGMHIAFGSNRDSPEGIDWNEIYVMNADGSGQTRLTNNPADDSFPAWQP